MKNTINRMGGGSRTVRKILFLLIIFSCTFAAFAQNVKPYTVDLNKMPAVNDDNTATFDKASKTVTVKSATGNRGIYLWLDRMDISSYNIVRVKYKALGDYGFFFTVDSDDNIKWDDKTTYCHSYLNEMVIPLLTNQKKLNGICFSGWWDTSYEQFAIESVTFEKVSNPVKTDIYSSNEPPVIDTATIGKFDDKINAWDFVKKMGVGLQYNVFECRPIGSEIELVMDYYLSLNHRKPSKEVIKFIKDKGFKTIRLQTGPNSSHLLDENYTIDPRFIKAIKQVVDWAIEEDMYVILCGPFSEDIGMSEFYKKKMEEDVHYAPLNVSEEYKGKSMALIKAVWKQYAAAFNNSYDEHLIFETLNEPIDSFHEHVGSPKENCDVCKKDFAILNEYNQLIVDTVRAAGGNNSKRFILIEGLGFARWQYITTKLFKMPKDKTKDRLIPCFHNYPMDCYPWQKNIYTDYVKKSVKEAFAALDKTYFSKHIPVYISEVGHPVKIPVLERINGIKDFMTEVTKNSRSCSVTMHDDGNKDSFKYYDHQTLEWTEPEYIDSLLYAAQGKDFKLSDEFIKNNEIKPESIVGKNLLSEPLEFKNWDEVYIIKDDVLYRHVPSKYKFKFQIEKTGSKPILQVGICYLDGKFTDLAGISDVKLTGAVKGHCFDVKSETITVSISEKLAKEIINAGRLQLNGQDIIVKSMKVIE